MKKALLFAGIAAIVLLSGCTTTTTTIYDPSTQQTNLRQRGNVSAEEFRIVAKKAIDGALSNPKFMNFLASYKAEMNNPNAIPVMKLTKVRNETDDPDLKIGELTDLLSEALLNSGIVDVTIAEGADLQTAIAASRDLACHFQRSEGWPHACRHPHVCLGDGRCQDRSSDVEVHGAARLHEEARRDWLLID